MSENVKKETSGYRRFLLPAAVAVLGILLLVMGSRSGGSDEEEREASALVSEEDALSAEAFCESVEQKIAEICSGVSGAGAVQVVVTLDGGYRAVYASDIQGSDNSYRNQTVLTGSGSSEKAILVGYESPRIVGIGIVCAGGDDPNVQKRITMLVSAAFDVSANKIYVTGGKRGA